MKTVFGVGINDSPIAISRTVEGKTVLCHYYITWKSMLERCYSARVQNEYPTYIGCAVVDEWLRFSGFKAWMETQDWENKCLDKDILTPGNKLYGPDTCVFVPHKINTFMNDCGARRGKYKTGVSLFKRDGRFLASINIDGMKRSIGLYSTEDDAHRAWVSAKLQQAKHLDFACDTRVKFAVIGKYSIMLESLVQVKPND